MKLTQLIERLSPEERSELGERYGVKPELRRDANALRDVLSRRDTLSSAFYRLNRLQLLLLRWLARQPGLEASWERLQAALAGRAPEPYLIDQLLDLRLWGIADYDPSPGHGFLATYPTVTQALPASTRPHLLGYLTSLASEELRLRLARLGVRQTSNLKDDRLRLLYNTLTVPSDIRMRAEALSPEARTVLDWVASHNAVVTSRQLLEHPAVQAGLERGRAAQHTPWNSPAVRELEQCGLMIPSTAVPWLPAHYGIPDEVEAAWLGRSLFDTGPLTPPALIQVEATATQLPDPQGLCRDIGHTLGFIASGRCEFKQADREPYQRSLQALGRLVQSPFKVYPELLWRLVRTAGLVAPNDFGWKAAKVGKRSPAQLYNLLWNRWLDQGLAVEYRSRYPANYGLRQALLHAAATAPAGVWLSYASFATFLAFTWPLYFGPDEGGDEMDDGEWMEAALLVFAHGSDAKGAAAIMVPTAVQAALYWDPGKGEAAPPGMEADWDDRWTVQADRSVLASPTCHPDALRELWEIANPEANQGAPVFRITAESISGALNRGVLPKDIASRLEKRSGRALPPTVARLIQDQGQRYGRIKVGWAQAYVVVDDPALLEEILRQPKLKSLGLQAIAPSVAAVHAKDSRAALDTLRKAGYLPVEDGGPPPPAPVYYAPKRRAWYEYE